MTPSSEFYKSVRSQLPLLSMRSGQDDFSTLIEKSDNPHFGAALSHFVEMLGISQYYPVLAEEGRKLKLHFNTHEDLQKFTESFEKGAYFGAINQILSDIETGNPLSSKLETYASKQQETIVPLIPKQPLEPDYESSPFQQKWQGEAGPPAYAHLGR